MLFETDTSMHDKKGIFLFLLPNIVVYKLGSQHDYINFRFNDYISLWIQNWMIVP
jgi:hypothetical protein